MSRVLIFGLDGATFDLIAPWAAQGYLPTLRRLMDDGVWGPLESTVPPMTSPAWPSFATGKFPAKHGVFDFVSAHSGTFNIVNATAIDARTLWEILSVHGHRVGVINVPVTYPPRPVNGFLISGLLSPLAAKVTYPGDLLDPLESELGRRYRVMPSIQYKPGNEDTFIRDLESLVEARARFAERLMRDHPWDFMMVHFLATDLAQHALWRFMDPDHPRHQPGNPYQDAIRCIYQRVDAALGRLIDVAGEDTTVIVMSDHGFGPLHGVVNLNILLWQKGLLRFKHTPLAMLRAFTFRHGITPSFAYGMLSRLGLHNLVSRVSKSTRNAVYNKFLSFDDIDWGRTTAYSLGHVGQIYLNVTGGDYDGALQAVVDALGDLRTPDGRPMVERVIRRADLPGGAHAAEGRGHGWLSLHLVSPVCHRRQRDQQADPRRLGLASHARRVDRARAAGPRWRAGAGGADRRPGADRAVPAGLSSPRRHGRARAGWHPAPVGPGRPCARDRGGQRRAGT